MPLDALALALGAAVLHALWNLLLARERDTEAATAVALISLVAILVLPAVLTWHVESAAVPYVRGAARGLGAGALIAAVIAGYTVVDRYGIHHANAAPYLLLVMLGPALVYPVGVGRRRVAAALSPATVVVGAASAGAYLLVLLALRLASAPAVAAVRETSVVIATALAALVLHERVGAARLAGATLVVAGVVLLAVF